MGKKTLLLLILFIVVVIGTRLYNLAGTARFTQDESSDLVHMQDIWMQKRITLVGPISNDGTKVFSALSYYMILPFVAAFDFVPVAPVYGMAFWGVVTAILLVLLAWSINKKMVVWAGVLIAVWYPLVLMSRWSWNPHFVAFWAALALLAYQYRKKYGTWAYLLTGLSLGAMFHHHYVALFSTAAFLIFASWQYIKNKKFKPVALLWAGYLIPYAAFVLFDLKNPPGLFFGQYLFSGSTPNVEYHLSVSVIMEHFVRNIQVYLQAFVPQPLLQILFGFSLVSLLILEIKKYPYRTLLWMVPGTIIIAAGIIFDSFEVRYVFPSLIFVLVWLLLPREEKITNRLAQSAIGILIVGSLLGLPAQLTQPLSPPSMRIFTEASNIIVKTVTEKNLKNINIAALESKDSAPLAERYRDYLSVKGVTSQAPSQYDISEHLFVISTATDEELRNSADYAMGSFKNMPLHGVFQVGNTEWKVFWYGIDLDT